MKNNILNYTKGELTLMSKKQVVDVYFGLLKHNKKKVLKTSLMNNTKESLIDKYISLRNKNLIWG